MIVEINKISKLQPDDDYHRRHSDNTNMSYSINLNLQCIFNNKRDQNFDILSGRNSNISDTNIRHIL